VARARRRRNDRIRFARNILSLTVLNVAYPFAPVTSDPVGGAEQVIAQLDRALIAHGHRSIVVAAGGSRIEGQLVPIANAGAHDELARPRIHRHVRAEIDNVLAHHDVDIMHFHDAEYSAYLPGYGPPALVSLHLPLGWYERNALRPTRLRTWLQPVSAHQARSAPMDVALLAPIENGVDVNSFPRMSKRRFALMLGRVCREKGFHEAIEAAQHAGVPLLLAGNVFPWPEHRRYFRDEIQPRLDSARRWIGAITGARKRRLLAAARCVLIPSRVEETSSLVAMEALAAGTPVIAYCSGALTDIVQHGITGYLVNDVAEMAQAIGLLDRIDPHACREAARARFPLTRTTAAYLQRYAQLASWSQQQRRRREMPT
jgi:glycosyltransferase involved in cell wall biosynthesis